MPLVVTLVPPKSDVFFDRDFQERWIVLLFFVVGYFVLVAPSLTFTYGFSSRC